jgi:GTP-binding protein EngB required for normal cell division
MDYTMSQEVASARNGKSSHSSLEVGTTLFESCQETEQLASRSGADAVQIVREISTAYRISSIQPLLDSCANLAGDTDLRIAVFGRFKAGKSSFLNHLLERPILPIGVVPVTSVVTEIGYGPKDRAVVRYLDSRTDEVSLDAVYSFVAEAENPENRKRVALVSVDLSMLRPYKGILLVDTPGLESVFTHNTEASLSWLPNVGLAIVAIGVDPPLSQRDIELIENLYQFTPKVSVLLTKVDTLTPSERTEVETFVKTQLARSFHEPPEVFSYSNRPGFEDLKRKIKDSLLLGTLRNFSEQRSAIVGHKIGVLVRECEDYLRLALRSAQVLDTERESLKKLVLGEKQSIEEIKTIRQKNLWVSSGSGSLPSE